MARNRYPRRCGRERPPLGYSVDSWTKSNLQTILTHFGRRYGPRSLKFELIRDVSALLQERLLSGRDLRNILLGHEREETRRQAHRSGQRLRLSIRRNRRPLNETEEEDEAAKFSGIGYNPAVDISSEDWSTSEDQDRSTVEPPADTPSSQHECTVCFETLDETNTPKQCITSTCEHAIDICRQCLATSIDTQFNSKTWDQIQCPSCGELLSHADLQVHAEEELFQK